MADLLKIDEHLMRDRIPDDAEDDDSLPTNERIVEAMQLVRYEEGQEYSPHHESKPDLMLKVWSSRAHVETFLAILRLSNRETLNRLFL